VPFLIRPSPSAENEEIDLTIPPPPPEEDEELDDVELESIMLQAVSGEDAKLRKDRAILSPWIKYLWEAYRTILDVLRNNAKLQGYYHQVARHAFAFCFRFKRTLEFRRLGEILRNHLLSIEKFQHQFNAVDLNSVDTQRMYLETRFDQLKIAAELELWQEAYRSIEDIHEHMRMSSVAPKPELMKSYYEMLSRIFWASENLLFHAYSLSQYYKLSMITEETMDPAVRRKLASAVLLATLSISPSTDNEDGGDSFLDAEDEGNLRLASLLGFKKEAPTRARLIKDLVSTNFINFVTDESRSAYELLEVKFGPLSLTSQLAPIFNEFSADEGLSRYVDSLKQIAVLRLLQQLSSVFSVVKLDKLRSLAPEMPAHQLERAVLAAAKTEQVPLRIDHK
jgi:translation initiation factor 3 subunit A